MHHGSVEWRLLGSLEVLVAGQRLQITGGRQRRLVVGLLLDANRVVSVERLVDLLWDTDPPATATAQVRRQVWVLRRFLAGTGQPAAAAAVVTSPAGYRLQVEPGNLDLDEFERGAARGRRAYVGGRLEEAGVELHAALSLWRGVAFDGVSGERIAAERARLAEHHLAVLEERIQVDLELGRSGDLVAELSGLVAEHPLRERLRGQHMLALHGAGRQAEALAVYRDARRVLADELGLEPSAELQRLQRTILNGTPGTPPPRGTAAAASASTLPVPAQLPPDLLDFTGRAAQVKHACDVQTRQRDARGGGAPAVVITAVAGAAGVGKTALAVHAAHQVREHFPHGQLFADLQGTQPRPTPPEEVLAGFLRALGIAGQAIPPGLDERAALFRSVLADRRVLVVLDNAADHRQVRPMLPGGAGCGVLVTSRVRLTGLEGADLLELDVMEPEESHALLAAVAGRERVSADPDATAAVARACGQLPLALRIAGARLAARPVGAVRTLASRLSDQRRTLDELAVGEIEVRSSLAFSYQGLAETERRAFRLLGLLEGPDFAAWVAAALLDTGLGAAERLVERLADAHLLAVASYDAAGQVRYRFHDILRLYARERAEAEEGAGAREAALERVLGAWLALAEQAATGLPLWMRPLGRGSAPRWRSDGPAASALVGDAVAWFEAEREALAAAVGQAAAAPALHETAAELAAALTGFFMLQHLADDWRRTHQAALDASVRAGNRHGEATMRLGLAQLGLTQHRGEEALTQFEHAAALFDQLGDRRGQAYALHSIGVWHRLAGRLDDALAALEHAAALFAEVGDQLGTADVQQWIGVVRDDRGDGDGARACFEPALAVFERYRVAGPQAQVLRRLAAVHQAQGEPERAQRRLEQAIVLLMETGDHLGEAYCRQSLGALQVHLGRTGDARLLLEQALTAFEELGDRLGQGQTLRSLGELHHGRGDPGRARASLEESLRLLREIHAPLMAARTLGSLGTVHADAGDVQRARAAWREALAVSEELGAPEAAALRARLARLA